MPNDVADWTGQQRVQLAAQSGALEGDVSGAVLSPDSATETIFTSPGLANAVVAILASFKAAAGSVIAQRGALGAFTVGSPTAVNPPWGQAVAAGSLGVAWVSAGNALPITNAAGWVQAIQATSGGNPDLALWVKPNLAAGEAAPTFTAAGGSTGMMAQLAEFTGAATVAPTDRTVSGSSAQTSVTAAMAAADAASGDLILLATGWPLAAAARATFAQSFNNGAAAVHAGDSGAAVLPFHSSFTYAIIPAGLSALPLGVQPWPIDVSGTSVPATGSQATVTLAASPGKAYICYTLFASSVQTTAVTSQPAFALKDGANTALTFYMGNPATIGSQQNLYLAGLSHRGTAGNAMSFGSSSGLAGDAQAAYIGAYLR